SPGSRPECRLFGQVAFRIRRATVQAPSKDRLDAGGGRRSGTPGPGEDGPRDGRGEPMARAARASLSAGEAVTGGAGRSHLDRRRVDEEIYTKATFCCFNGWR